MNLCAHYDEDEWGAALPAGQCQGERTHYSCCYGFAGPNVCERHKCRCKQATPAPSEERGPK